SATIPIESAKRDNPDLTDAQAFAKVFTDQSEAGVILRRAFAVAKNAAYQSGVDESEAACRELAEIGKQRWPSLTRAQQFDRAAQTTPTLLAKAHRRPSPLATFSNTCRATARRFSCSYQRPTASAVGWRRSRENFPSPSRPCSSASAVSSSPLRASVMTRRARMILANAVASTVSMAIIKFRDGRTLRRGSRP